MQGLREKTAGIFGTLLAQVLGANLPRAEVMLERLLDPEGLALDETVA